ncbi:MAG TPA: hypothetical protein VFH99_02955 [Candidatus Saccharimonadales bacterium]|nr:hypothetical protein [Candidatus Saccharimonadales bacterium]
MEKRHEADVLVADASGSLIVQDVLGVFAECNFNDPSVERDCRKALRKYLANACNVPLNRCEDVLILAETAIRQGASNG